VTERGGILTIAFGIAALALAAWAAGHGRAIATTPVTPIQADLPGVLVPHATPAPIGTNGFWIAGWVGPPPALRDAAAWRAHAAAGLDVSMGPLEDRYRRADNLARLAFLDSLRAADGDSTVPFVFVRDDSLHPDEATRPGWERRVEAIVRAYAGSRSLAGYFLADEPRLADSAGWAPTARLLRRLDPAHPAYVNFLPIRQEDAARPEARAGWSNAIARTLATGRLGLFTFDAYPFPVGGGERPHFLATLRAAADLSRSGAIPFGVVLQWTGHGQLRSATRAEALYQATQALVHGAAGITWFTWWTPNPAEEPWRWRDGAIAYDGTRTARADTLAAVNRRVRAIAAARGPGPMRAVHVGGGLPHGLDPSFEVGSRLPPEAPVTRVIGGPATLGWTLSTHSASAPTKCVLANRDRANARAFTVTMRDGTTRSFTIPPGDAVVF